MPYMYNINKNHLQLNICHGNNNSKITKIMLLYLGVDYKALKCNQSHRYSSITLFYALERR